jgi:hypothetical protein
MSRAMASALRFLAAAFSGAQASPLLAVELFPDAARRPHDVTLFVMVRGGS